MLHNLHYRLKKVLGQVIFETKFILPKKINSTIISGLKPKNGKLKMKKPTVYITQVPHRKDAESGAFVPAVNITPAEEHGGLVVMMPPRAPFYATADLVRQLREHLKNYDYEAGDSLVALGDPAIIAAASMLLGSMFGKMRILRWDRNLGRYISASIQV